VFGVVLASTTDDGDHTVVCSRTAAAAAEYWRIDERRDKMMGSRK